MGKIETRASNKAQGQRCDLKVDKIEILLGANVHTNRSILANSGSKNLFVCRGGSNIDSFVAVLTSSEKIVAPLIGSCPNPSSGSSLSGQNDRDLCDKKIERFYLPTTLAVKSLM